MNAEPCITHQMTIAVMPSTYLHTGKLSFTGKTNNQQEQDGNIEGQPVSL